LVLVQQLDPLRIAGVSPVGGPGGGPMVFPAMVR
jgi:hypothetical protein